jgi:hypothetical protein
MLKRDPEPIEMLVANASIDGQLGKFGSIIGSRMMSSSPTPEVFTSRRGAGDAGPVTAIRGVLGGSTLRRTVGQIRPISTSIFIDGGWYS